MPSVCASATLTRRGSTGGARSIYKLKARSYQLHHAIVLRDLPRYAYAVADRYRALDVFTEDKDPASFVLDSHLEIGLVQDAAGHGNLPLDSDNLFHAVRQEISICIARDILDLLHLLSNCALRSEQHDKKETELNNGAHPDNLSSGPRPRKRTEY
jgi:hypothetical protein